MSGASPHLDGRLLAAQRIAGTGGANAPKRATRARAFLLAASMSVVTISAIGCAEGSLGSTPATPAQPPAELPPYDARAAELFDDAIEPEAVGFPLAVAGGQASDTLLRARTQAADAVVRARIVTVTSNPEDRGPAWQIGLQTLETLAGARPPTETFSWLIRSRDPAAGILRAGEGRMVGITLVAFLRTFALTGPLPSDGARGAQIHFHAGADSKKEVEAVRAAAALAEFR
jgi:hypothetical protein